MTADEIEEIIDGFDDFWGAALDSLAQTECPAKTTGGTGHE